MDINDYPFDLFVKKIVIYAIHMPLHCDDSM